MLEQENNGMNNHVFSKKTGKVFWTIVFILIAIGSIFAIVTSNKNFSLKKFGIFIKESSFLWIFFALLSVIAFIYFEGKSIICICKSFGYKCKRIDGFFYSAADIYFSAITPSASGGQPASAYFMLKDKIPITVVTIALLYNLLMYSIALILISVIILLLCPHVFLNFSLLAKILIGIGFLCQIGLILLFYFLIHKSHFLYRLCSFFLKCFTKWHILSHPEEKFDRLKEIMKKYQDCAKIIKGKRKVLFKVLLFNLLQRLFRIAVIVFTFLATYKEPSQISSIIAIESLVIVGSYCMPIPGAIGVTDYLMLNGYSQIMSWTQATNLELFSRGLSFYCCIIICGIAVIIKYLLTKRSSKI